METARQLTEAQAKKNAEIAIKHQGIAEDNANVARIELETAQLQQQKHQLEQLIADQSRQANVMHQKIAQNEGKMIEANMDLAEIQIAYGAFSAITASYGNVVVSASVVAGFVFVPLAGQDLRQVDDDFTSVILVLSTISLVLLLHTVYMATEATVQGTKQVYEVSNSAAVVWSGVETMTIIQKQVMYYYYMGIGTVYLVIPCLVWASILSNNTLSARYVVVGVVCTLISTVWPYLASTRANAQIKTLLHKKAAETTIDRKGLRSLNPHHLLHQQYILIFVY